MTGKEKLDEAADTLNALITEVENKWFGTGYYGAAAGIPFDTANRELRWGLHNTRWAILVATKEVSGNTTRVLLTSCSKATRLAAVDVLMSLRGAMENAAETEIGALRTAHEQLKYILRITP